MKRSIVLLSLVTLHSAFGFPQTPLERLSEALGDLRGINDAFESSGASSAIDRKALWVASMDHPLVTTMQVPAQKRDSLEPVSAKRLRHKAPKAARKAYERAAKSKSVTNAAKDLEAAIALDPDFAEAHNDLGVAFMRLGRYPEAAAELRRAIALVPEESLPRYNLARVPAFLPSK